MPDSVTPPSDADLAPGEPMEAGAAEAEPTPRERLEQLRTIFLGGLLALGALAASYIAAEIVLPILLAFVLNLVFRPVLRLLLRARLPQPLAALIIVLSLVALFVVGARLRIHGGDQLRVDFFHQRIVQRHHAVGSAGLQHRAQFRNVSVADSRADAGRPNQNFGGQATSISGG